MYRLYAVVVHIGNTVRPFSVFSSLFYILGSTWANGVS